MANETSVFSLDYVPSECRVSIASATRRPAVHVFEQIGEVARLADSYFCRSPEAAAFVVECLARGVPVPRGVESARVRERYRTQAFSSGSSSTS